MPRLGRSGCLGASIALLANLDALFIVPQNAARYRTSLHFPRPPSSHPLSHSHPNPISNTHHILRRLFDPLMGTTRPRTRPLRTIPCHTNENRHTPRPYRRRLVRARPSILRNHAVLGLRWRRRNSTSMERREARACVPDGRGAGLRGVGGDETELCRGGVSRWDDCAVRCVYGVGGAEV